MELKRVVVTGLGALTPVGNTVEETWENLSQEHISAIKEKPKEFILKAIDVAKQIGRNN